MLLTSSDTKRTLMHLFLLTNSTQRELVSICTQSIRNCFFPCITPLLYLITDIFTPISILLSIILSTYLWIYLSMHISSFGFITSCIIYQFIQLFIYLPLSSSIYLKLKSLFLCQFVCFPVCLSDHNSGNSVPIRLKFWLGNLRDPRECS